MSRGALNQLDRILYILPRAAQEGGVSKRQLAAELEVTPDQIVRDVDEVLARGYYHPASTGSAVQALFSGDLIQIVLTGDFKRPTKLTRREGLSVALALRSCLSEEAAHHFETTRISRVIARLEEEPGDGDDCKDPEVVLTEVVDKRDHVRDVLLQAHREQRRCEIRYLSVSDESPARRVIHPYLLAHGDGHWYAVSFCEERAAMRTFRFDRILDVELLSDGFEVDPEFDPASYTKEGQVYDGQFEDTVQVEYSAKISSWVKERWIGAESDSGAYQVEHRVSDARWIIRHVLRYGGEAVVRGPGRYRKLVREAASEILES